MRKLNLIIATILSATFVAGIFMTISPSNSSVKLGNDTKSKSVVAEIYSVDLDNSLVYITYNGELYSYEATGNVIIQGNVYVTFNEQMEIIDVQ